MWRFNARVGYEYVPSQTITTTTVVAGKVSGCGQTAPVNAEGNIGPTVPDYDTADLKVALFGDSFSASSLDGMTWPALLQDRLESITGNRTRVLNLARDGYGVLQMFELAAAKIREVRPHLAIFAFNSSALQRARTWRIEVGDGRESRFLTSSTPVPTKMTSHDMMLLEPAATFDWCNGMLGRNRQQDDPVLQRILRKTANRIRRADLFDVTASYVVDLLAHQNAFSSQLAQLPSGIAPKIAYTDYRSDPQFINAVQAVEASRTPYLLIHLPLGVSLRDHQEFWLEPGAKQLLESLQRVTRHEVIGLKPLIEIAPDRAMEICLSPTDCHPSKLGMDLYAKATARVVQQRFTQ
jgi:hypothetical protein